MKKRIADTKKTLCSHHLIEKRTSAGLLTKKLIADTKKTLCSHHFIEKEKLSKYMSGMLSMYIDDEDMKKKTNQFINNISDFNNKHIIQCYNEKYPIYLKNHVAYHP